MEGISWNQQRGGIPAPELWSGLVILRPKPTLQQIDAVVRSRHSWRGPGGEGLSHFGENRKDATGFGFNNQNGEKITKKVVQYFSCKGYYST